MEFAQGAFRNCIRELETSLLIVLRGCNNTPPPNLLFPLSILHTLKSQLLFNSFCAPCVPGPVLGHQNREVGNILCPQESLLCKACQQPLPHVVFSLNTVFVIHPCLFRPPQEGRYAHSHFTDAKTVTAKGKTDCFATTQ